MMTGFIFIGDMLVTLFMISIMVWAGLKTGRATAQRSGDIPLGDE